MGRRMKPDTIISQKQELGRIYQTKVGGNFYLQCRIDGRSIFHNFGTNDYDKALAAYKALLPTLTATDVELVAAQVKVARNMAGQLNALCLSKAWDKYSASPERAMPSTVSEQLAYKLTFEDFVTFINDPSRELHTITYEDALRFSEYMKTKHYAVDTHNRKIKRLRKIFNVLSEYCNGNENPFMSQTLLRKAREEQDIGVRRMSFTHEHEKKLLEVLDDPKYKVMNKEEIKVIYYLGLFTGQRLKDCVLLRWSKVDLVHRKIECKQFKTGKEVTIPIAAQLLAILQSAQTWKTNDFDYVCPKTAKRYNQTNSQGKNTGNGLVNIDVLRPLRWIGLETSVKVEGRAKAITVYGFHSLRHSFASHCAEAGVPKAVVQSILGDECEILDAYYTHVGEEAQQKAIEAIAGNVGVITPQEKIRQAIQYLDTLPNSPENQRIREILTNGAN